MSGITRRLSIPELSQQILQMAELGVYRESILEAFQPLATQKEIRCAIAHAKRFGLHSVPNLRDAELGTYYQLDQTKYQSLQHLLDRPETFGKDADLIQRVTQASQSLELTLTIARGVTVALTCLTIVAWCMGGEQISLGLLGSTVSAAGIWALQKALTGRFS
ncbi:hypothetical protein BST81_20970 [Leptolyngbya sp. 'hensonii']|uniref:hypothetical protein n=1 Tax=Leptolyngbya sp. 'hensonii' TaxID=1922337 RepID=UPI0009502ECC|nr:hypothetical protein [Leptolyngbya sp. 'hensonii']OLP16454.1 hypothetical protein BST81_20970 [Leptolyngbya sp. 'hensonii']